MAGLTCIYCRTQNAPGEQLCRGCFRRLPTAAAAPPRSVTEPPPEPPRPEPPVETPDDCPHCGAEVPDPGNRVCVECHRPLSDAGPLRLSFPAGEITVHPGQEVAVGRDPASSPVAGLFADRDNVSRLHATVGVNDAGAWIRDEKSLNGTYVNNVPVPPGTRIELADGDILRLAADVTATVRIAGHPAR
jgi:hypothetical protein